MYGSHLSYLCFSSSGIQQHALSLLQVKSIRLVGILLVVFIQEKHEKFISHIDSDSVATGIMGIMVSFHCLYPTVRVFSSAIFL